MNDQTKNCSEIILLLDAYHDNEVTAGEREIVEKHLANCLSCSQSLAQIASLVKSLQSLPLYQASDDLIDRLDNLLPLEPAPANVMPLKPQTKVISFRSYQVILVAGAACACLIVLALRFMPKGNVEVATINNKQILSNKPIASIGQNKLSPAKAKEVIETKQELAESVASQPQVTVTVSQSKNKSEHIPARKVQNKEELATNISKETKVAATADTQRNQVEIAANNTPPEDKYDAIARQTETSDETPTAEIATVYEGEPRGTAESIGIATDEDGLYALKL